jgi:ABC-2 type transport system ATP-binding protein
MVVTLPKVVHRVAQSELILETRDLVKRFGNFTAVNGLSFAVKQGEIFGFLGPNGAGKTTAISMLSCLFPPTSGTADIGGYDLVKQKNKVKKIIGVVPQELAVYPTLSTYDNLMFFGGIYGLSGKLLKERVKEALDIVALTERANEPVKNFSGGMKRRANIAAGLLHHPQLLFLDEPTVGVDPQSRNYIFESVQRLNRERGMTVIYTSHYMEEVETLCNRIAIVDKGKLVALGTKQSLLDQLGGGVLYLNLSRVNADIINRLKSIPTIRQIEQPSPEVPRLNCQTSNAQQALVGVIPTLAGLGVEITGIELSEPNLESVFLYLTGKKLRD